MMEFELTPKQIEITKPYLDIAAKQAKHGKKGIIVAQIARMNSGKINCIFDFIPKELAEKIMKIMKDYERRGHGTS